ncbi:MAG: aldehyde dehydrogenase [Ruthenibacterium sp.]
MKIETLVLAQHRFFAAGNTRPLAFRKQALAALRTGIQRNEKEICAALSADLHKSDFESYLCEIGLVLSELTYMERHLQHLAKPKRVKTPLAQFAARSFVVPQPLGVCLVMSPWNYPFMLSIDPIIGAIAAGNCVILKPSAYAAQTSKILKRLISEAFDERHVCVVEGGRAENTALLEQKFEHIFFTGSVEVGKLVMEKAAHHLTPVTLELGGKSPCIVDETANIPLTARRLVFGKYLNAGQTCVAPDYLFVHEKVHDALLAAIQTEITAQYGADPLACPHLGKIVNEKHFARVCGLLEHQKIVCGGSSNAATQQLAPTVLDDVSPDSPVMQEEIFGPILPVMTFTSLDTVIDFINNRDKPLALYLFTTNKHAQSRILAECTFGGGCINDTVIHLATSEMGFGGVGESGMGSYHGKLSFSTFTHDKSIVQKANWMDLPVRYQPASKVKEKVLRLFLK